MASASTVLLLFLCFLLITSVISMLMLQGVYNEGDHYENNQCVLCVLCWLCPDSGCVLNRYFDFSTAFITMLVFIGGGDNYVEAATVIIINCCLVQFLVLVLKALLGADRLQRQSLVFVISCVLHIHGSVLHHVIADRGKQRT